jgi:uncharacterized membrane protein
VVHLSNLLERGWLTAIGICIFAMAVLHLTVGGSAIFVQIGLFVVIIAVVVRKYRPQSMGQLGFFQVREWVGLLISGIMFMAIGIFFIIFLG